MKQWYWDNGPSSTGFIDIAETLQAKYTQQARQNFDELCLLRAMDPNDYSAEPGETATQSHRRAIEKAEHHHRRFVGKGLIGHRGVTTMQDNLSAMLA